MLIPVTELAFHQRLGRLMAALPAGEFWPELARFLGEAAAFDTWVAMLFHPGRSPTVLADRAVNYTAKDLFADYRKSLYLLDPFYVFCQQPAAAGVYRVDEVAPEHFRETEYFRCYFSRNVVEDEVQLLAPLGNGDVLSFSMGSRKRFSAEEIGAILLYFPWIKQLMTLAAPAARPDPAEAGAEREQKVREQLRLKGSTPLTDRELDVALLILAGHPAKNIARQLNISHETVKAHRRNLYAKLNVTAQAGLFLLMLEINQAG
ncbi:helix-turn-helix transcriptional regulator [uncultured Aquitalea sp.]|uniref:helix-turn-helix transcriptional regulator n=1 Tax=uncultured Aquitalea sp. TaxID=540272 RepID=UPI0025CC14E2|nr:helix-turn-helix transcriptional regulator [uncultured Aquitalea sp.]